MMRKAVRRVAAMDRREVGWRAAAAARVAIERARFALAPPRWNRRALAPRLLAPIDRIGVMLRRRRFEEAHRELSRHFARRTPCFVVGPGQRAQLAERIARLFPAARDEAARRGDRVLFGAYDLLGYRGLRFDESGSFAWNGDPVHDRRAPRGFWATVPYLNASSGDHKIIWELNRHQHWLVLGRALWLTGDRKYRDRCVAELASWMEANPPLDGINWASMLELAFRSLSWVWALHLFADPEADDRTPWVIDLLLGVDRQLAHVERNLSLYFSPNTHLLGEALALYVCGRALPELAASGRRADVGRRILLAEIGRQIAGDGGHCERSTHYHRYALDFYLLASAIARITHDPVAGLFDRTVERLAAAARLLADDRGRLPHLGDDDGGMLLPMTGRDPLDVRDSLATASALLGREDLAIDGPHEETSWLLANPIFTHRSESQISNPKSLPSGSLPETGYFVSRWSDGTHIVIDGGAHGFQNGGHAHADALSVAVRASGVPLLVDPGTACYTIDAEQRDRFRSSAMHNTVTIDGRSQSTPKGPFHWSRTADASVARWRVTDAFDYFDGWHGGYDGVVHRRHVLALHEDLLIVADLVDGSGVHEAAAHWHLHPRWTATIARRSIVLSGPRLIRAFATRGETRLFNADGTTGLGWMSPVYGRVDPATTIRVSCEAEAPFWMATVFDFSAAQDVDTVDAVPVWAEAGTLARSVGLRISRASSIDYLLIVEPESSRVRTTWRIAEFETDAHMLFVRTASERQAAWVAIVDGSMVRGAGRGGPRIALPDPAAALHLDVSAHADPGHIAFEPGTKNIEPRT
jgi:Heparinase II/III-like protein/Heparinase II/III N-terminus